MKELKNIWIKTLTVLSYILSVFIIGIFFPIIISLFVILFRNDITFADCIYTGPFWIVTLIGWVCGMVFINQE